MFNPLWYILFFLSEGGIQLIGSVLFVGLFAAAVALLFISKHKAIRAFAVLIALYLGALLVPGGREWILSNSAHTLYGSLISSTGKAGALPYFIINEFNSLVLNRVIGNQILELIAPALIFLEFILCVFIYGYIFAFIFKEDTSSVDPSVKSK